MKNIFTIFLSLFCVAAFADTTPVPPIPPAPAPVQRVSVFSTTVDWAAVTGLPLNQYTGTIKGTDKSLVKDGLVLYYLDSFLVMVKQTVFVCGYHRTEKCRDICA